MNVGYTETLVLTPMATLELPLQHLLPHLPQCLLQHQPSLPNANAVPPTVE
jgi:hypothetical protein